MNHRFLQLHWLASYPGVLLNRDEAGLAKRLPFGGATRGRVSSQSLKRHWRFAGTDSHDAAKANPWSLQNLGVSMGHRTKRAVENAILPRARALLDDNAAPAADINDATRDALLTALYAKDATDPKKRQALYFGESELDFLARIAADALRAPDAAQATRTITDALADRQNLRALKHGAGLESALFGRMVTSDRSANVTAAVHVAHALTVHPLERELDFMTVVDDLATLADTEGSAGMFDTELTSGLYYGYLVVDLPLLAANLAGDRTIAANVARHLVHLVAQVSPGAKKGSTAPYAWAQYMLAEFGARQPRTLANAFLEPVSLAESGLAATTMRRLTAHLDRLDAAYGADEVRRQLAVDPDTAHPDIDCVALPDLADWCARMTQDAEGSPA